MYYNILNVIITKNCINANPNNNKCLGGPVVDPTGITAAIVFNTKYDDIMDVQLDIIIFIIVE